MWKYEVSNTDHSLMQGVELVSSLLCGEPETTIGMVYDSTADGRNAAVHERPRHAGSGDPGPRRATAAGATAKAGGATGVAARRNGNGKLNGRRPAAPAGDLPEAELAEEELGITSRPTRQPPPAA